MPGFQDSPQFLASMIGPVANASFTTEQSILGQMIGNTTFPANFFQAGDQVRVRAKGIKSASANTATFVLKIKFGALVFTFGTYTASGALSNRPFTIDFNGTIQLAGASGTMWGNGEFLLYEVAGAAPLAVTVSATTAQTIDTTAAAAFAMTGTQNTSSATDAITVQQLSIELLR